MNKFVRLKLLLLTALFLAGACAPESTFDAISEAPGADPDPEFMQAVAEAHETIGEFYAGYFSPSSTQRFAGIRVRFPAPGSNFYEYHWTEFVDYYNHIYTVRLIDSIDLDSGQHTDRPLEVAESDVVDWIIIQEDGTFTGGYTMRLAYKRMTPEERKQFIESTGYVMD
jgi:hypothetical protein